MTEVNLWFTRTESGAYELERTVFARGENNIPISAVRGKTSGAYQNVGNFQWTPGVRAVISIFLTALLRQLKNQKDVLPMLEGGRNSLASSLDYALNEQPQWLFDIFGADENANAYLRQVLLRSNAGRKIGSLVRFTLNEKLVPPQSIKIFVENAPVPILKL